MRLFVGTDISPEIKEKIISIQKQLSDLDIKLVEPENLHFCLRFLGKVDDDKVEEIKTALNNISFQRFNLEVNGVGAFPNEDYVKVLWIGVSDDILIKKLAELVNNALTEIGIDKEERPFRAHITLGRTKSSKGKDKIQSFINKNKDKSFGVTSVNNIVLISSNLTPNGPIYEEIHKVELHG